MGHKNKDGGERDEDMMVLAAWVNVRRGMHSRVRIFGYIRES